MGILSVIKSDVEELVKSGYPDFYISKSVGVDPSILKSIINYVRSQQEVDKYNKISNKDSK